MSTYDDWKATEPSTIDEIDHEREREEAAERAADDDDAPGRRGGGGAMSKPLVPAGATIWVVVDPGPESVLADICWSATIRGLGTQAIGGGGLGWMAGITIYASEADATADAMRRITDRDRATGGCSSIEPCASCGQQPEVRSGGECYGWEATCPNYDGPGGRDHVHAWCG